jgi:predicted transcriptional regulator
METAAADSRLIELASDIVAAYVSKNAVRPKDLVLEEVHQA